MKGLIKLKFTPEIIAALQTLKDAAENDFERHRISVLEQDLTAPPVVEIIDDTLQKFNGVIYYANKKGHFHKDTQLHRAVYSYCKGLIPEGDYDIHHIDRNKANNMPDNLQLLTRSEHQSIHGARRIKTPLEKICPVCKKSFIRNDPNQKYCSWECYVQSKHTFISQEKICPICGKSFHTISENPTQIYCSRDCANKGKTFLDRNKTCPTCGKKFITPANNPYQIYCCRDCAIKMRTLKKTKICPVCGKKFIPAKSRINHCSISCAAKAREVKKKKRLSNKQ